jgi:ATP-dependent RNA helicase DOB1
VSIFLRAPRATSTGTKRPPDAAPEGPAAKKPTGVTVALREGDTQMPPYPANPAKQYPFELDPFQRDAIACLETGDSVMVAAHTSAGKTAVAEYAIAMCLRDSKRVIYTSPIKALSNQKYRDLCNDFENMGLMTGDVTINPNADCLIMTTEILRSMLYRGNEMLREVGCVVFDEIHYMRDKHRGVVWEETIILLPDAVQYVFLSATIPNAGEFAEWIERIHPGQRCRVVYTDYRPTPLQHYVYPAGAEGIYCVVDETGKFKDENFKRAMASMSGDTDGNAKPSDGQEGGDGKGGGKGGKLRKRNPTAGRSNIFKLIRMVMDRSLSPCIVFSFSKKECEALALQLSKLDLNDEDEKRLVMEVFTNAMDALSDEDRRLPQVEHIQPLLKRGIGIHHSGLLPILKEVIEILFQEGLVKVLFSTETFAMGLNMPARTVIFTSGRKFDGDAHRWLTSGEYIQMSGRAGRRGLDPFGIAILMIDEAVEPDVLKQMTSGKPDVLNSAFHLGYNMILNLLRVEEVDPEYLISRSFYQFQVERQRPQLQKSVEELEAQKNEIAIENEEVLMEYYGIRQQLEKLRDEVRQVVGRPEHILNFLQPGRLIHIRDGDNDYGWSVCLNFHKIAQEGAPDKFTVDVLCWCVEAPVSDAEVGLPKPCTGNLRGEMKVVAFNIGSIYGISKLRVSVPQDLKERQARDGMKAVLEKVKKAYPDKPPIMDPVGEMGITDQNFKKAIEKVESLEDRMLKSPVHETQNPQILKNYAKLEKKMEIVASIQDLKKQIKAATKTVLRDDLKARLRILRRLEYTNEDNVIQTKGRTACEVNTADELLLTELIFNGIFNEMTSEQIVALMSCLVNAERTNAEFIPKEEFRQPLNVLYDASKRITKISVESKLAVDEEKELQKISPSLMDVTYAWAKGAKFSAVCGMTDVFEGSIIRMMRRLEELLRQLAGAARAVGDLALSDKFMDGITKIKRDIVFAASLYL